MKDPANEGGRSSRSEKDTGSPLDPSSETSGWSRRRFLQAMGLGVTAAGISSDGLIGESAAPVRAGSEEWGPGSVPVEVRVNGKQIRLKVEPRVTLLDALRNHMRIDTQEAVDVTGPKRVCDRGSCGACSVILDGRLVYACSVLAVEADGSDVLTVEGVGAEGALHPLQEEVVESDGSQCGFCTPGFVMASLALLDENADPSPEEIKKGLDGNICRCGTQPRFLEAVEKAAARLRKGRR